jgi:hypothetical protein
MARFGRFFLAESVVEEVGHLVVMEDILSKCFVVRCEYRYESLGWEYIAYSKEFARLSQGCMVPEYQLRLKDGRLSFVPF